MCNLDSNPPHVNTGHTYEIDDTPGEPSVQREDDSPEAVAARVIQYKHVAKPVIELHKS